MERTTRFIASAMRGDADSLEWVVSRFQPIVETQVRLRLGVAGRNEADVSDIVADTWVVVLPKLATLEAREGRLARVLGSYLGTTALHKCNHFLASSYRRLRNPDAEEPSGSSRLDLAESTRGIVTRVVQREECLTIRAAIETMPDQHKEVLVMRLLEHRSNEEIAASLGIERNTAAVRYRRALHSLRNRLPTGLYRDLMEMRGSPRAKGLAG